MDTNAVFRTGLAVWWQRDGRPVAVFFTAWITALVFGIPAAGKLLWLLLEAASLQPPVVLPNGHFAHFEDLAWSVADMSIPMFTLQILILGPVVVGLVFAAHRLVSLYRTVCQLGAERLRADAGR